MKNKKIQIIILVFIFNWCYSLIAQQAKIIPDDSTRNVVLTTQSKQLYEAGKRLKNDSIQLSEIEEQIKEAELSGNPRNVKQIANLEILKNKAEEVYNKDKNNLLQLQMMNNDLIIDKLV